MRDDDKGNIEEAAVKMTESTTTLVEPSMGGKSMRAEQGDEGFSEDLMDNLDLREARPDLLKIDATVGKATMKGIVDSGSLKRRPFKVTGVNGTTSICRSKVPWAVIYLTPSKLQLGRPWGTYNGVGIEERTRGTYVSWISGKARYELNASKAREDPVRVNDEGYVDVAWIVHDGTDRSYVPDSEESRLGPDYLGDKEDSEEERLEVERANARTERMIAEWKRQQDEEERREREERGRPPRPNQLDKGKGRARSASRDSVEPPAKPAKEGEGACDDIIEVDEDMEEAFVRVIQGENDEDEWETFHLGSDQ